MRSLIFCLLSLAYITTNAQDTLLALYGSAVDIITEQPVKDLKVTSYTMADTAIENAIVGPDGSFMLGLFDARDRIVIFEAPGYVPRRIMLDMKGPDRERWANGYGLSLQMSLYEAIPGMDLTMDEIPVGRSIYNADNDVFEWDRAYSRSINEKNKELLKAYKQRIARDR